MKIPGVLCAILLLSPLDVSAQNFPAAQTKAGKTITIQSLTRSSTWSDPLGAPRGNKASLSESAPKGKEFLVMAIHYQEKRTTKVELRNVSLQDTKGGRYSALGSPKGTSESSFSPTGGSVGVSRTGATITPTKSGVVDVQLKMAFMVPVGTIPKQAVVDGLVFSMTP